MSAPAMPLDEIRRLGLEALRRELGPVGMVRFLQQFESGQGDYTADRSRWVSTAEVDAVAEQVRAARSPA
jgi:hypothetical protein